LVQIHANILLKMCDLHINKDNETRISLNSKIISFKEIRSCRIGANTR